jgi:hypothetical protein
MSVHRHTNQDLPFCGSVSPVNGPFPMPPLGRPTYAVVSQIESSEEDACIVCTRSPQRVLRQTRLGAVLLVVAAGAFLGTGWRYALTLSSADDMGTVDGNEMCFDAHRSGTHTVLHVSVGTPASPYRLLVRTDVAIECTKRSPESAVALASMRTLQSSTLRCESLAAFNRSVAAAPVGAGWSACVDTVLGGRSVDSFSRNVAVAAPINFGAAALRGPESALLNLDGEFRPCLGSRIRIGSTRLCISTATRSWTPPVDATVRTIPVRVRRGGYVTTTRQAMREAGSPFVHMGAAKAPCDGTDAFNDSVVVLPSVAGLDIAWRKSLAQGLDRTTTLASLRAIQGAGIDCVASLPPERSTSHLRALVNAAKVSCHEQALGNEGAAASAFCEGGPSLGYTNVASSNIALTIGQGGEGSLAMWRAASLDSLESHVVHSHDERAWKWSEGDDDSDREQEARALDLSFLRLAIVTLAALVLWTRREDDASKTDTVFLSCLELLAQGRLRDGTDVPMISRLLGLLAAVVRLVVATVIRQRFVADGEGTVAYGEIAAAGASLVHWATLHVGSLSQACEDERGVDSPTSSSSRVDRRSLLGGSSSVVDVSCTIMVVFSKTPLHEPGDSFDDTARMLVALLLSIAGITRVLLSTACSAAGLLPIDSKRMLVDRFLGVFSTVYWVAQAVQLALLMVRLFAAPFSISMCHQSTMDPRVFTSAVFIALSAVGACPRLCANARAIVVETTKDAQVG